MSKKSLEFQERINLVKNSLLSAHYLNRWKNIGLQHILNSLLLLFLERRIVVVVEKITTEKGDVGYKILHHTCSDPFWKLDFENYLETTLYKNILSHDQNGDWVISGSKTIKDNIPIEDCLIPFCGNKHFMFHTMKSDRDDDPWLEEDNRTFDPVPKKGDEFLSKLSDELVKALNNENIVDYFSSNDTPNKINILKVYDKDKQAKVYEKLSERLKDDWPEDENKGGEENRENEYFRDHFSKIKNIFDQEYEKIQNSALLKGSGKIPDIFFSIRMFSQQECRFDDGHHNGRKLYPHGVRLIIPDTQRDNLEKAFIAFRDEYASSTNFPRLKNDKDEYIDDFFWENLNSGEGRHNILDTLSSPYGPCARAMSDAVFESGYINIKQDPFSFGATNRLEPSELKKGPDSKDFRIAVYFHYMLLILFLQKNKLPSKRNKADKLEKKIFSLLVPGNIGGSPFFCLGFVYERKGQDDHQNWLNAHHFYHTIAPKLISNIRRKVWRLYLDEIQNIYVNEQDDILETIAKRDPFVPARVCDRLNPRLKMLSRVFSFQYIQFRYVPKSKSRIDDHKYVRSDVSFTIDIYDNPFFTSHVDGSQFLSIKLIKECLADADNKLTDKLAGMVIEKEKSGK